jgi:hypothetical protein
VTHRAFEHLNQVGLHFFLPIMVRLDA